MVDTSHNSGNRNRAAKTCAIPLPKGDENTTRLAKRYARAFSYTLKEKQFVALCNVSTPLTQAITLGAWIAGNPVAFINPAFTKIQLNDAFALLGACLKIGRPDCLASLENKNDWLSPDLDGTGNNNLLDRLQPSANENSIIPYEWNDDECAAVLFTSGTTGKPKGVCHSIGNLTRTAELFIEHYSIKPEDLVLTHAPLHSSNGVRVSILLPLLTGCRLIECRNDPELGGALNIFRTKRPTVCVTGPIFIRQLAMIADKLDDELNSIRVLISVGGKLDRISRVRIWERHQIPVLDYYGLTEVSFAIGTHADHFQPELDIIGQPFPGSTIELMKVESISDHELGLGQIRIYSPNIFLGYLGEPLARKRFYDTGDLGMRDENGNFSLKGRMDHGVKSSSTIWLFPQALEQLLGNRPDVVDAHVRSEYDKYDRGVLYAKVIPADGETVDDDWLAALRQDIEDQLGPEYKAAHIEIVNAIPRTVLGKVIKSLD